VLKIWKADEQKSLSVIIEKKVSPDGNIDLNGERLIGK